MADSNPTSLKALKKDLQEFAEETVIELIMKNLKVLKGPQGKEGIAAKAPIKGVDFLTPQDIKGFLDEVTPRKGTHFRDGFDGKEGSRGFRGPQGEIGIQGKEGREGKIAELNIKQIKGIIKLLVEEAIKKIPKQLGGISRHRGGLTINFNEIPSGAVDGSNKTYTLTSVPKSGTLMFFLGGALQLEGTGNDFTLSSATITILNNAPPTGANLTATYQKR